jgi:nicotinate-nucleotide adenylyltransferase
LGIFGGTFDPVHYGHLLLAESCREQCRLDEVWFLPTSVPPHKLGKRPTPDMLRVEMLELAVVGQPAFSVSRYEVDRGGVNYTFETLRHFRDEAPGRELFFLMGADMLNDLPNWREPAEICRLAILVAVRRPGADEPDFGRLAGFASADRIEAFRRHQVEMPEMATSARDIRRRAARGGSIRFLLPRAVEEYILSNALYRDALEGQGHGTVWEEHA